MDRLNHVKIVTPHPEYVDAFLREVCDIPAGWPLGENVGKAPLPPDAPLGPGGELTMEDMLRHRGAGDASSRPEGFIVGNPESRQFQVFHSESPQIWAICIGSRHIERAYERCKQRGIPATPITVADWNERDNIRNFFCIVGGVMFEVIRVEPKQQASSEGGRG